MDRPSNPLAPGDGTLPVEARLLVISANGAEPELAAMSAMLAYRGVPHDVFIATERSALTASQLQSGSRGLYQGIILTTSSLAISGSSALSAAEWAVLANYEQAFDVRRAVLAAWPDPALGFGSASQRDTSDSPLTVHCTSAGEAVFRDVNCADAQELDGDIAYLASASSGVLTPLLTDSSGHALAALRAGSDGRDSLLLTFRQHPNRLHSLTFLHGVLGWVTGGSYLGERRLALSAQLDDMFFGAGLADGSVFRLDDGDMQAARAWLDQRRGSAITPDFHVSFAFNGSGADSGDALTEEVVAQNGDWYWINHTWGHGGLDTVSYSSASTALSRNVQLAQELPLDGFDVRDLVTPSVSGLINGEAMRAAADVGIRYAVTDTSRPGCGNPSPNTTFYNGFESRILLLPRRPTNMAWNVSTPDEWVDRYNAGHADDWGRDSTYEQVIDQESDVLLHFVLRGDLDPFMFHQANLRAYDGAHSIIGELLDATLDKVEARLTVPVQTPPMWQTGQRFARRINFDTAGVRATLFRGRALVIDVGRSVSVPVTGVRAASGESYGGDVIGYIDAVPGSTACVALDAAGQGCSPAPTRTGGAGATQTLPIGYCDASDLPHPPMVDAGPPTWPDADASVPGDMIAVIARDSTWRYWDRGGDLGTTWRSPSYSDSTWASGAGPLGYGESYLGTTVGYGPSATSKYITTYFRRSFTLADPSSVTTLLGELMYDDGAVIYLNGVELERPAMPSGAVTAATLSSGHEAEAGYQSFDWSGQRSALVVGSNVITVEVHQAGASSSDLVFDLALSVDGDAEPPPPPPPPPVEAGGISRATSWWYWDDGGNLGTAWRTLAAPGTGWDVGQGPFGYGESYLATTVSYGPSASNKYVTTYFLKQFSVADPAAVTAMLGEVMYDDGVVVYLNGVELGRGAMPTGTITSSTLANNTEAGNLYQAFDWTTSKSLLVAGTNILAVEVHQAGVTSSDLVFDLALTLDTSAPPPPPPPPPVEAGGISRATSWWYWDDGGNLGTAWRTLAAPGTGWDVGPGPLGYGESYLATTVSYGPSASSKYLTTYLLKYFSVADPAAVTAMLGEVMYDDGVVVYLNGVELGRAAMPTGTITSTTLATGHEAGNSYQAFDWSAGRGALRGGTNVLAVELHQAGVTSSDLAFDLALTLDIGVPPPPPPAGQDIARGSVWRFWDHAAAPSASWATPGLDDSSWSSGPGPFGYGESFIVTPISYGSDPNDKIITTYFRRWFTVAAPSAATLLRAELIYDDGVVVYLNGHEISRLHMPTGSIGPTTLAPGYETGAAYQAADWSAFHGYLVPGANLLAVEVHQAWLTSSDLAFDLALDVTE